MKIIEAGNERLLQNIPNVYFGAADRQMEFYLQYEPFLRSLLFGLLFQGNLVIPDIFFYISNHLSTLQFDKKNQNIIDYCIRKGYIIPFFRSETGGNFIENYKEIKEQGILGMLKNSEKISKKLDNSQKKASNFRYGVWPKARLSVGFEKFARDLFIDNHPKNNSNQFNIIWERTEDLRKNCIIDAINNTSGEGLQRGEIYKSIINRLHIKNADPNDSRTIYENLKENEQKKDIRYFIKWVNYIYQFNQGIMFDLMPSLTKLDSIDIEFTDNIYDKNKQENPENQEKKRIVTFTSLIPTEKQLLTINFQDLFDIRDGEEGIEYFKNLSEWQNSPTDNLSNDLLNSIKKYITSIDNLFNRKGTLTNSPRYLIQTLLPISKNTKVENFLKIINDIFGIIFTPIGYLANVSTLSKGISQILPSNTYNHLLKYIGQMKEIKFESTVTKNLFFIDEKEQTMNNIDCRFCDPIIKQI